MTSVQFEEPQVSSGRGESPSAVAIIASMVFWPATVSSHLIDGHPILMVVSCTLQLLHPIPADISVLVHSCLQSPHHLIDVRLATTLLLVHDSVAITSQLVTI
jgi:hypothetical protein